MASAIAGIPSVGESVGSLQVLANELADAVHSLSCAWDVLQFGENGNPEAQPGMDVPCSNDRFRAVSDSIYASLAQVRVITESVRQRI